MTLDSFIKHEYFPLSQARIDSNFASGIGSSIAVEWTARFLRQVLFDVRAGNSDLAKSLSEKSNHAMYQDENPDRGLLSLENHQN